MPFQGCGFLCPSATECSAGWHMRLRCPAGWTFWFPNSTALCKEERASSLGRVETIGRDLNAIIICQLLCWLCPVSFSRKDSKLLEFNKTGKSWPVSPWISPVPLSPRKHGIKVRHWSERLDIFCGSSEKEEDTKRKASPYDNRSEKENIFQWQPYPTLLYPFVWAAITDPYAKRWKIFFRSICLLGRLLSLFYWQLWNHHWVCCAVLLQMVCMGGLFPQDEISLWT